MVYKIQHSKKYKMRDSPSYSAQDYKGKKTKGTDGKIYKSESDNVESIDGNLSLV